MTAKKKPVLVSFPADLEDRLRAFLVDPSVGYIPHGALSKFVAEAVEKQLKAAEEIDLGDIE